MVVANHPPLPDEWYSTVTPEEAALDGGLYAGERPLPESRKLALSKGSNTANGRAQNELSFDLVDLRTRKVRAVKWIEEPYLARGELHVLQGHGGVGKGAMSMLWAAEASRRKEVALIVTAEDDLDSSVYPRLIAAGADFDYIRVVQVKRGEYEDALTIPDDLAGLEAQIVETSARLLTIDPLLSHISGKSDSYKDAEMKRVLTPLSKLAQRTGCSVLGVHHFKKDVSAGAKLSGQGSGAFYTTARVTLAMAKGDDDLHVLEVVKSNIGPEDIGQNFRLQIIEVPAEDGDVAKAPLLVRDGDATQTVDELLAKPRRESKSGKARDLLLDTLDNTLKMESDTLDALIAQKTGLSTKSIRNLRGELADQGLIKSMKGETTDDQGNTKNVWFVLRTHAPRTEAK